MSAPRDSPEPAAPDAEAVDASRRTHLANERTFLAWLRTGLTAFAVAIGVGQVVPALTDESGGAYALAGIGFAALGVGLIGFGVVRMVAVDRALARGVYRPAGAPALAVIAAAAGVLGVVLAVLLVVYA